MYLTPHHITNGWRQVRHVVGRAWSVTGRALHAADRYVDVATRLASSLDDVVPAKAMQGARGALDSYARGRTRVQDVRDRAEGVYARTRGNVPELF